MWHSPCIPVLKCWGFKALLLHELCDTVCLDALVLSFARRPCNHLNAALLVCHVFLGQQY
jgi:hypothetical protein